MKKHLTVKDVAVLLANPDNTMGSDVPCVVVIGGKEYPVVGVETYDGVFCRVVVGKAMRPGGAVRQGNDVFVKQ